MVTRTVVSCIPAKDVAHGYFKALDVTQGFAAVAENDMQIPGQ